MPSAILFDLNGTLSDDERLFFEIYRELFAEAGRAIGPGEYFGDLAGLSDETLIRIWLGEDYPFADELLARRVARFEELAAGGATVPPEAREAVRVAAANVPVGVVSSDFRAGIELLLRGAGLLGLFSVVVSIEDVSRPKPAPDQYVLACERLGLPPADVVAVEDTAAGVAAAKAAGVRCVAVLGTHPPDRLAQADTIAARVDAELVGALLARPPGDLKPSG